MKTEFLISSAVDEMIRIPLVFLNTLPVIDMKPLLFGLFVRLLMTTLVCVKDELEMWIAT